MDEIAEKVSVITANVVDGAKLFPQLGEHPYEFTKKAIEENGEVIRLYTRHNF